MGRQQYNFPVGISAGALIFLALVCLVLPLQWVFAAIVAGVVHELFHYLAVRLCGGWITDLQVGKTGAFMQANDLSLGKSALCSIAGPLGSGLLILLYPHFPRIAFCGLIHCLYNLLPLYPLDGARALQGLLAVLFPRYGEKIFYFVQCLTLSVLAVAACHLSFFRGFGFTPIVIVLILGLRTIKGNFPCKDKPLAIQ